jgi:2-keto-3-deoxy-L-rhamnonate aldolase RhmA
MEETMNGEQLKQKVNSGGIVYGTMLMGARNPRWAQTISEFGLDYVIIDTEHTPRSRVEVADFLAAFSCSSAVPIVRIPIPSSYYVTMYLDAGAQGILAPYCETVEEAKEVVAATKFRPLKGEMARLAVETGQFPSETTKKYLEARNKNNVCIIGIESVPAINNLDNILKIKGIDAIFVGPNDLSITLGIPDQYDHPDYEAALREIITKCKAVNVPVLIHHMQVDLTKKWLKEGANFVLHNIDSRVMHNGYRDEFAQIKKLGSTLSGDAITTAEESKEVI